MRRLCYALMLPWSCATPPPPLFYAGHAHYRHADHWRHIYCHARLHMSLPLWDRGYDAEFSPPLPLAIPRKRGRGRNQLQPPLSPARCKSCRRRGACRHEHHTPLYGGAWGRSIFTPRAPREAEPPPLAA